MESLTSNPELENSQGRFQSFGVAGRRLTSILPVAANRSEPLDKSDASVQQVKVVAEARNQRYLHIAEGWLPRFS